MIATSEFKTISVLGTEYTIIWKEYGEQDIDGETDFSCQKIYLRKDNVNEIGDFLELQIKVLRHEIIHAFMYESGLGSNWKHDCQIGHDETVIDWFAIQSPKIYKVYEQLGIL